MCSTLCIVFIGSYCQLIELNLLSSLNQPLHPLPVPARGHTADKDFIKGTINLLTNKSLKGTVFVHILLLFKTCYPERFFLSANLFDHKARNIKFFFNVEKVFAFVCIFNDNAETLFIHISLLNRKLSTTHLACS